MSGRESDVMSILPVLTIIHILYIVEFVAIVPIVQRQNRSFVSDPFYNSHWPSLHTRSHDGAVSVIFLHQSSESNACAADDYVERVVFAVSSGALL